MEKEAVEEESWLEYFLGGDDSFHPDLDFEREVAAEPWQQVKLCQLSRSGILNTFTFGAPMPTSRRASANSFLDF